MKNKEEHLMLTPELAGKIAKIARKNVYSGICDSVRRVVSGHPCSQGVSISKEEINAVQGRRNDFPRPIFP